MDRARRACVIGAGSSGIAAVKALQERSIPFDCFEKLRSGRRQLGVRQPQRHVGRLPRPVHQRLARADGVLGLPMPTSYPDFPHHTHIAEYFDAYVDHFGLREHITFETGVEHAAPPRGRVVGSDARRRGETRRYDALLVANGHHWDPRWPEPAFPGADTFTGEQLHAHSYVDNSIFAGQATSSSSAWATPRWTSRSSPPTWLRAPTSPRGAAPGSSPSTCSADRSISCPTTRASRSRSASA